MFLYINTFLHIMFQTNQSHNTVIFKSLQILMLINTIYNKDFMYYPLHNKIRKQPFNYNRSPIFHTLLFSNVNKLIHNLKDLKSILLLITTCIISQQNAQCITILARFNFQYTCIQFHTLYNPNNTNTKVHITHTNTQINAQCLLTTTKVGNIKYSNKQSIPINTQFFYNIFNKSDKIKPILSLLSKLFHYSLWIT